MKFEWTKESNTWVKRFWYLQTTWTLFLYRSLKGKLYHFEECLCDCWTIKQIKRWNLIAWHNLSCWCFSKVCRIWNKHRHKHWESRSPIYGIFRWILARCNNPKNRWYKNYGGRWIKCLRKSFEHFYKDMWESYYTHIELNGEDNTSIERINNNWNYSKRNCVWATRIEQNRNRRTTRIIEYNWERLSIRDWCRKMWYSWSLISNRLNTGRSIEDAITLPPNRDRKLYRWCKRKSP